MNTLSKYKQPSYFCDELSRVQKLLVDAGQAESFEEAEKHLSTFQIGIEVGSDIGYSPTLQAAVLTAVNAAVRIFQGGVFVVGALDVPLSIPFQGAKNLADSVILLGAHLREQCPNNIPRILFGGSLKINSSSELVLRATFNGWTGAVISSNSNQRLAEKQECELAGVLAGALAISEVFQYKLGNVLVGKRDIGLSLWQPNVPWFYANQGPKLFYLPKSIWIIGLGNLGQAYLWSLATLPYPNLSEISLTLQDFDKLTFSNQSTSMLTSAKNIGEYKTRAIANWCEDLGFNTRLIERPFNNDYRCQTTEPFKDPRLAFYAVDNVDARKDLEKSCFDFVVEAGLGSGSQGFLNIGIHTFPGPRKSEDIWKKAVNQQLDIKQLPSAYQKLKNSGFDDCGIIQIANRAVSVPFVGTIAATLVVSQPLRLLHGGTPSASIDWKLNSPEYIREALNNIVSCTSLDYIKCLHK